MKAALVVLPALAAVVTLLTFSASADNQVTPTNQLPQKGYTADPTARVFGDTLYVYTSTDDPNACKNKNGFGQSNFCMPGYKVFWTKDLKNWQSKTILTQWDVPWVSKTFVMWAPDLVKNGDTYYLLFPHKGRIGVATSKSPTGPFTARKNAMGGAKGIDPSVVKHNGKWHLYTSWKGPGDPTAQIYVWDVDGNFNKASNGRKVQGLFDGYKEGPHVYQRNGNTYMLYARVAKGGYRLELARSGSPTGRFWSAGEAVPNFKTPNHGSAPTNHGSIVDFKGNSYVFYHRHLNKQVPRGSKTQFKFRTVLFDRICYKQDGNIIPAVHGYNGYQNGRCSKQVGGSPSPTPNPDPSPNPGNGVCSATGQTRQAAIDNYNQKCTQKLVDCDPIDGQHICANVWLDNGKLPGGTPAPAPNPSPGGSLVVQAENFAAGTGGVQAEAGNRLAYITHNDTATYQWVDFSKYKGVKVSYASKGYGGTLELRSGSAGGPVVASFNLGANGSWSNFTSTATKQVSFNGNGKLVMVFKNPSKPNSNQYLFNVDSVTFVP